MRKKDNTEPSQKAGVTTTKMNFKKINRTEFKGKIIGMVLGDAYLTRNRKNSHLAFKHSVRQKEYFDKKVEVLKELTSVNIRKEIARIKEKEYEVLVCETKSHPIYTELKDRFYYQNRKTIDEFLMKTLSVEGFAYWYLDDGTKGTEAINQSAWICTDNFNLVEQEFMCYWLAKRFGLHFEPKIYKKNYRLKLRYSETEKLVNLIEKWVPESMKYKIDFKKPRDYAKEYICQNCQKTFFERPDYTKENPNKFCSKRCLQKYLWKMGRSNLFKNKKLRRYSLNFRVI